MKRILLSAFACDPTRGSERSNGWSWAVGLAMKGFDVHCITREVSRSGIGTKTLPPNLKFTYVRFPLVMERLYSSDRAKYLYYLLWQWKAYKLALAMHKVNRFDLVHHITFGSLQMGSFMYKFDIPFIFGPAGGGQMAPAAFREFFGTSWSTEETRSKVSRLLIKFNPAFRPMLKKASHVLAANEDTFRVAKSSGGVNVSLVTDVGVPDSFIPLKNIVKTPRDGQLKLLWVGGILPRKGLLLTLELMNELKGYPGITLTVVGDGPMRNECLEKLQAYALEDTVHWEGSVPFSEIGSYYSDHDVFLFTSLRESGGVQLVEAMAYGMPVITLDLHGPGLIVNETRGIKCACDTPDIAIKNLKAAVLELYRDPARVARLSEGSFRFSATQVWSHKIETIVNQFYD